MRFKMHRAIAIAVFQNETEDFRSGCCIPDWIKRSPIHRRWETFETTMDWYQNLSKMEDEKRDLYTGFVCHFVCDYTTFAHGKRYYNLIGHRIYEVAMQKYYLRHQEAFDAQYLKYCDSDKNLYRMMSEEDKCRLSEYIWNYLEALEKKNESYGSKLWCLDRRIMKNDIKAAYVILDILKKALEE